MLDLLLVIAGVVLCIILQGLRKIPADPPCVALVTLFGKPLLKVKESGWRFFFLCPFVFGYILIDVTKKNNTPQELPSQIVIAPDLAKLSVPLEVTWSPKIEGQALIEYVKSGKEEGVWKILAGIIQQRLREWAISSIEGPQTAEALLKAGNKAVAVLIKAIVGSALPPIPSPIPTVILLDYFQTPRPPVQPEDEKIAGKNWEELEKAFGEMEKSNPEQFKEIKEAVKKRREVVNELVSNNGHQEISSLGIELNRLNIGEIKPEEKYAAAMDLKVKEEQERKAEIFETETDLMKAEQLCQKMSAAGQKISLREAFEIIMKWKATREGHGFAFPGGQGLPIGELAAKWLAEQTGGGKQ